MAFSLRIPAMKERERAAGLLNASGYLGFQRAADDIRDGLLRFLDEQRREFGPSRLRKLCRRDKRRRIR